MALQVKRKNIGQPPTRSNPYLNQKNIKYAEGGDINDGPSRSSIEKKLALDDFLRNQKILPENQGKKYSWYERNIKNPLENKGINTDAIEFGLDGAIGIEGISSLAKLTKSTFRKILTPKNTEELVRENINWWDTPSFKKSNPNFNPNNFIGDVKPSVQNQVDASKLNPFDMKSLNKEQYKEFMRGERLQQRTYNNPFENLPLQAIGGMINPYKQIIPQETNKYTGDDYEDDYDDEDMYESDDMTNYDANTEKDNIINDKIRELDEKNKMISSLQSINKDNDIQQSALSVVNMPSFRENNLNNPNNGAGVLGKQIIEDITNGLGYTPQFNSIFRDQNKQAELVKRGIGVKNSFHLTGDAVDMKPADWNKLSDENKYSLKSRYDVITHNNHTHIEPKGSPYKK